MTKNISLKFIIFTLLVTFVTVKLVAAEVYASAIFEEVTEPISPIGQWLFNNAENPLKATVGADLKLVGRHKIADGPMPDNGAVTIGADSHYILNHGIEPKGGESYVNEYAILYDFKIKNHDEWAALLQTNPENSDDAKLFIRKDEGTVGVMETGYSKAKVTPGEWHRLIVSVDNGTEYSLYLDGEKILTGNVQETDGAYALHSNLLLFADDSGDDSHIDVARVDLYDVSLKPEEIAALGKVEIPYNPFLTSPYLQNATKEGITIMWETDNSEPGRVHFGKDDNYKSEVTASSIMTNANTYINKATIKGLKPGTKYNYFVVQAERESKKMHFTTDPKGKKEDFTTTIWGDSHYPNPWSKMVEYMMTEIQPDFALNTGDISNSGNRRPDLNTVFLPHVCEGIGSYIPFYSALGNHDVGGRWGGGDLIRQYHDQPKKVNSDPDGLSGSYLKMYSNVAFIFIDWNRMETDLVENGWLEQTLQSKAVKNARFRFVLVHAPPFVERWQNGEESSVKENLPRMAEAYKVNAVFSGHMHGHERGIKNGVHYLTIGGGSYLDHGEKVGPIIYDHIIRGTNKPGNPSGLEDGLKNHFVELEIKDNKAEIKIHYFNSDGSYIGVIESIPLGKDAK